MESLSCQDSHIDPEAQWVCSPFRKSRWGHQAFNVDSFCGVSSRGLFIEKIPHAEPNLISRETRRLVYSLSHETDNRDAIEHNDDRILKDEREPDHPVLLRLSDTKEMVLIGSEKLRLDQLRLALSRMHQMAQSMLDSIPRTS